MQIERRPNTASGFYGRMVFRYNRLIRKQELERNKENILIYFRIKRENTIKYI